MMSQIRDVLNFAEPHLRVWYAFGATLFSGVEP